MMKLLEKDPAQRYATMTEAIADLKACLNRSRVRASPFSVGRRLDLYVFGHRRVVLGLMLTTSMIVGGVVWHRAALRAAGNRQVVPQAEAASRALELDNLRQRLTGEAPPEVVPDGLREAEAALLTNGGAKPALAALDRLLAVVTDPAERRELQRSQAWTQVACGEMAQAQATLLALREEHARRREILRIRHGDPRIRDARYALACLDEALAKDLAGEVQAAAVLWQQALEELPSQAPQAALCAGALGERSPSELAQWAAAQRPTTAALGFLVAVTRAPGDPQAQAWAEEARRLANPALPWVYYYLTYGPGAGSPTPTPPAPETRP